MTKRNGGPKSARGKARSSRNAITHGLTSQSPVLPRAEDEEEWQSFRQGIVDSYKPDNPLEAELAERVALLLWLLRRVARYQRQSTMGFRDGIIPYVVMLARYETGALGEPEPSNEELVQRAMKEDERRILPRDEDLTKISRYESHLHRMLLATMHELEAIQLRRQGGQSPLARLDISAPPAG